MPPCSQLIYNFKKSTKCHLQTVGGMVTCCGMGKLLTIPNPRAFSFQPVSPPPGPSVFWQLVLWFVTKDEQDFKGCTSLLKLLFLAVKRFEKLKICIYLC